MDDTRYSVRLNTFKCINPFTIELRGCGQLYVVPKREYFFVNAPINFINYVAQLAALNVSYRLTNDSNGCYYTIDLTDYFKNDPQYIMQKIRTANASPIINNPTPQEAPKSSVVIASDDFTPRDTVVSETKADAELNEMIAKDLQENARTENKVEFNVIPTEQPTEATIEPVESNEIPKPEKTVYTETELSRLGKTKLLEISANLGLDYSDINTKKEIRDGILAAQNK